MTEAIQALQSENKMTDELLKRLIRLMIPCVYVTWYDGMEYHRDKIDYDEALEMMHNDVLDLQEYVDLILEQRHNLDESELKVFIERELNKRIEQSKQMERL